MNLLSYYKTWSSHARWWLLLVGGVCTWALPASVEAGRPLAPAVQSAPVAAPQFDVAPQFDAAPQVETGGPVGPAVPVPSGPVRASVPVPTVPVPTVAVPTVAVPSTTAPATGSSRRNSPAKPTAQTPTAQTPTAQTPTAPKPAPKPAQKLATKTVVQPVAPQVTVAQPVAEPAKSLEPIAAKPTDTKPSDVKPAQLQGFTKAPTKPEVAAPESEIPSETLSESSDRIEATPFPGEPSQAERMAGEESLPPVLDADTARQMISERRAADASEAARRRLAERQAVEAAAAQEAAKLLRPVLKASEPAKEAVAAAPAAVPTTAPQVRRPVLGPELPPKAGPSSTGSPLVEVVKPSVPVHLATAPLRPTTANLSTAKVGETAAKPVSTEQKLTTANAPARVATKPVNEPVAPAFRDRGPTPAEAELKRDSFQPAGNAKMRAVNAPQLAQVPGEAEPVIPAVPPPAVPVPVPVAPGVPAAPAIPDVPGVPAAPPVTPRVAPVAPGMEDPLITVEEQSEHFETIGVTGKLEVQVRRSILLRTKSDIYRTAVVDPQICDVVQFTPREVSIIGKGQGATNVTFWFNDGRHRPVNYVVNVKPDLEERRRLEGQYKLLQDILREQFPDSKVYLIPVADKLIVKGQARDVEEAAQIMAVIRGQTSGMGFRNQNMFGLSQGSAAQVLAQSETGRQPWPRIQVINLLRVPGIHQVALRVKIAELNRSAARGFGVDVDGFIEVGANGSGILLQSLLNAATGNQPALIGSFDGDQISVGVRYLSQHGVIRVLSEPTLVTMSGQPATFVAGGEFAVPTLVGSGGVNAVTTDFRAYGAIVSFMPVVLDKDRIRLQVAPEFSQIDSQNSVNGIPGMKTRAVTTTVEMREGQTLAIAGLLDDSMKATNVGDLPFLANIFGRRDITRSETELIILVTPELIQPMEPEEVPPLPGYDVTEPNNAQFYLHAQLEGTPTREYRSTIWHRLRSRYTGGGSGMISGPFGHGN